MNAPPTRVSDAELLTRLGHALRASQLAAVRALLTQLAVQNPALARETLAAIDQRLAVKFAQHREAQ